MVDGTEIVLVDVSGKLKKAALCGVGFLPLPFVAKFFREAVLEAGMSGNHFYPASVEGWIEARVGWAYWFCSHRYECFDVQACKLEKDSGVVIEVSEPTLDSGLLEAIPLEDRLMFASRCSVSELNEKILVHESVVPVLDGCWPNPDIKGYKLYPLSDWYSSVISKDPDVNGMLPQPK